MDHSLWAFIGISIVVIILPGPDTVLTIRNTLAGGRTGGVFTGLGVIAGQLVWALATSAGLSAILLASERAFHLIKLCGAVYLVFLGARSLWSSLRREEAATVADAGPRSRLSHGAAFRQGAISNLGNPKMAVFFVSIFPQFAPNGHATFLGMMSLGLVFSSLTILWLSFYAAAISAAADFMRKPSVRRAIDGIAGVALIGLGARLATERE